MAERSSTSAPSIIRTFGRPERTLQWAFRRAIFRIWRRTLLRSAAARRRPGRQTRRSSKAWQAELHSQEEGLPVLRG